MSRKSFRSPFRQFDFENVRRSPRKKNIKDQDKARRRLDLGTKEVKKRSHKNAVLKGHVVFIDLQAQKKVDTIKSRVQELGGKVEDFLDKTINLIITSQKVSDFTNKDGFVLENLQSPSSVIIPSPLQPFSTKQSAGRSMSPFSNESTQLSMDGTKRERYHEQTRGKKLMNKALCTNKGAGTPNICQRAKNLKARLLNADDFCRRFMSRKNNNSGNAKQLQGKPLQNLKKAPSRIVAEVQVEKLNEPFVKIEDIKQCYRPLVYETKAWPKLYCETSMYQSPFELPKEKKHNKSKTKVDAECDEDTISLAEKSANEVEELGEEESQQVVKRDNTVPPAKPTTLKDKKSGKRVESGYCDICSVRYKELTKHLKNDQHRKFVTNSSNFEELDRLIANTQPFHTFIDILRESSKVKDSKRPSVEQIKDCKENPSVTGEIDTVFLSPCVSCFNDDGKPVYCKSCECGNHQKESEKEDSRRNIATRLHSDKTNYLSKTKLDNSGFDVTPVETTAGAIETLPGTLTTIPDKNLNTVQSYADQTQDLVFTNRLMLDPILRSTPIKPEVVILDADIRKETKVNNFIETISKGDKHKVVENHATDTINFPTAFEIPEFEIQNGIKESQCNETNNINSCGESINNIQFNELTHDNEEKVDNNDKHFLIKSFNDESNELGEPQQQQANKQHSSPPVIRKARRRSKRHRKIISSSSEVYSQQFDPVLKPERILTSPKDNQDYISILEEDEGLRKDPYDNNTKSECPSQRFNDQIRDSVHRYEIKKMKGEGDSRNTNEEKSLVQKSDFLCSKRLPSLDQKSIEEEENSDPEIGFNMHNSSTVQYTQRINSQPKQLVMPTAKEQSKLNDMSKNDELLKDKISMTNNDNDDEYSITADQLSLLQSFVEENFSGDKDMLEQHFPEPLTKSKYMSEKCFLGYDEDGFGIFCDPLSCDHQDRQYAISSTKKSGSRLSTNSNSDNKKLLKTVLPDNSNKLQKSFKTRNKTSEQFTNASTTDIAFSSDDEDIGVSSITKISDSLKFEEFNHVDDISVAILKHGSTPQRKRGTRSERQKERCSSHIPKEDTLSQQESTPDRKTHRKPNTSSQNSKSTYTPVTPNSKNNKDAITLYKNDIKGSITPQSKMNEISITPQSKLNEISITPHSKNNKGSITPYSISNKDPITPNLETCRNRRTATEESSLKSPFCKRNLRSFCQNKDETLPRSRRSAFNNAALQLEKYSPASKFTTSNYGYNPTKYYQDYYNTRNSSTTKPKSSSLEYKNIRESHSFDYTNKSHTTSTSHYCIPRKRHTLSPDKEHNQQYSQVQQSRKRSRTENFKSEQSVKNNGTRSEVCDDADTLDEVFVPTELISEKQSRNVTSSTCSLREMVNIDPKNISNADFRKTSASSENNSRKSSTCSEISPAITTATTHFPFDFNNTRITPTFNKDRRKNENQENSELHSPTLIRMGSFIYDRIKSNPRRSSSKASQLFSHSSSRPSSPVPKKEKFQKYSSSSSSLAQKANDKSNDATRLDEYANNMDEISNGRKKENIYIDSTLYTHKSPRKKQRNDEEPTKSPSCVTNIMLKNCPKDERQSKRKKTEKFKTKKSSLLVETISTDTAYETDIFDSARRTSGNIQKSKPSLHVETISTETTYETEFLRLQSPRNLRQRQSDPSDTAYETEFSGCQSPRKLLQRQFDASSNVDTMSEDKLTYSSSIKHISRIPEIYTVKNFPEDLNIPNVKSKSQKKGRLNGTYNIMEHNMSAKDSSQIQSNTSVNIKPKYIEEDIMNSTNEIHRKPPSRNTKNSNHTTVLSNVTADETILTRRCSPRKLHKSSVVNKSFESNPSYAIDNSHDANSSELRDKSQNVNSSSFGNQSWECITRSSPAKGNTSTVHQEQEKSDRDHSLILRLKKRKKVSLFHPRKPQEKTILTTDNDFSVFNFNDNDSQSTARKKKKKKKMKLSPKFKQTIQNSNSKSSCLQTIETHINSPKNGSPYKRTPFDKIQTRKLKTTYIYDDSSINSGDDFCSTKKRKKREKKKQL